MYNSHPIVFTEGGIGLVPLSNMEARSLEERNANSHLERYMIAMAEPKESSRRRLEVMERIQDMLRIWATEVGRKKLIPEENLVDGGGIQVRLFGSTKLQVQNIDSDIDLLCIAPSFITRADFFSGFVEELSTTGIVNTIVSLPHAYTPVVKFALDGNLIDMVFASLPMIQLPPNVDLKNVLVVQGLDEASVRSLNGVRVSEWLFEIVPDGLSFQTALRAIKYWAKQRGLYSNVLGFLGGINYAILVAHICQLFPNAYPSTLVKQFFTIYVAWPWPQPVMLRPFEDLLYMDSDGKYLPVWNPLVNPKDYQHIMPIITPAYPAMNSSYNIGLPQFRRIIVSPL